MGSACGKGGTVIEPQNPPLATHGTAITRDFERAAPSLSHPLHHPEKTPPTTNAPQQKDSTNTKTIEEIKSPQPTETSTSSTSFTNPPPTPPKVTTTSLSALTGSTADFDPRSRMMGLHQHHGTRHILKLAEDFVLKVQKRRDEKEERAARRIQQLVHRIRFLKVFHL